MFAKALAQCVLPLPITRIVLDYHGGFSWDDRWVNLDKKSGGDHSKIAKLIVNSKQFFCYELPVGFTYSWNDLGLERVLFKADNPRDLGYSDSEMDELDCDSRGRPVVESLDSRFMVVFGVNEYDEGYIKVQGCLPTRQRVLELISRYTKVPKTTVVLKKLKKSVVQALLYGTPFATTDA